MKNTWELDHDPRSMPYGGADLINAWLGQNPDAAKAMQWSGDYSKMRAHTPDGDYQMLGFYDSGENNRDPQAQWIKALPDEEPQVAAPAAPQPTYEDPAPVGPTIYDSMDDWINIARREDYGRQNLWPVGPGTVPGRTGYQSIPLNLDLAKEMFFPTAANAWRDKMRDPFKGGLLKDMPGMQQS